jgi:hypothetical protein
MPNFDILINGTPVPQGSKSAFNRGGRIVLVEAAKGLKEWRHIVHLCAGANATTKQWVKLDKEIPVTVRILFTFTRPKTIKREHHTVKPDLDKLTRAVLDGITEAGNVWVDDSQVVRLEVSKQYGNEARAEIRIITQGETT